MDEYFLGEFPDHLIFYYSLNILKNNLRKIKGLVLLTGPSIT